ncbi:uncharacterized protein N0V89_009858 [Didymosphaeria variabile]|uniref:FAD linked oxidase N-terminal domain-containing protein n=1 Tax=Didymosphaeria variabile TaxID=1932322 RepID=A0A9W8XE55_9PLEO|nr:uncharacterized protein N0V89_009858 [Didymosphaeria variabile]KAJ4348483.1 hypothetical protein N0V89_009858 [Didymosphaeria variabile]
MRVLTATNTKFAVRSAGNLDIPGWNAVGSDGVIVALEKLDKKVLSADKKYATIGTGQQWRSVYKWIEDFDVQIIGNREPQVGVGGFLLGGIITEFEVMTSNIVDINYEVSLYAPNSTRAILKAYVDFLHEVEGGTGDASIQLEMTPDHTLVFYGHVGHVSSAPEFAPFRSIPVMTPFIPPTNGTVAQLLFAAEGSSGQGPNGASPGSYYGTSVAQKVPDANLTLEAYNEYLAAASILEPGMRLVFSPQGFTSGLVRSGRARNGGNVMGLFEGPQFWHDVYVTFPDVNQYALAQKAVDQWTTAVTKKAKNEGVLLPYIYANNANAHSKVLSSYGKKNFDFIKKTAKKYDPNGIMQTLQNDGFLIRKEA